MPSNKRPYLQYSIFQLEALFARSKGDPMVLGQIEHELGFRETDRAIKLRRNALDLLLRPAATSRKTASRSAAVKPRPAAQKAHRPRPAASPKPEKPDRSAQIAATAKAWAADRKSVV